jgi:hypothetical protein
VSQVLSLFALLPLLSALALLTLLTPLAQKRTYWPFMSFFFQLFPFVFPPHALTQYALDALAPHL